MTFPCPEAIVYPALTRTDLVIYAGASGDFNPLHHDPDYAGKAGLPDVMAHGMLSAGLLASALTKWFGAGSVVGYAVRFLKPVWPGDVLAAHCRKLEAISEEDGIGIARAELELVRANGDVVLAGTARLTGTAIASD